jgi:hypothetical protein
MKQFSLRPLGLAFNRELTPQGGVDRKPEVWSSPTHLERGGQA